MSNYKCHAYNTTRCTVQAKDCITTKLNRKCVVKLDRDTVDTFLKNINQDTNEVVLINEYLKNHIMNHFVEVKRRESVSREDIVELLAILQ